MKKNKLIELLQSIKGNPEIVIWNGLVDDYQPINNIQQTNIYAQSKRLQLKLCNYERNLHGLEPIEIDDYETEINYELPSNSLTKQELKVLYDKKKKVAILETKTRNKTMYDRTGKINY